MKNTSKETTTPLYIQLKNRLISKIQSGMLRPGDKLPSEAELQREYGMSRVTVRNAMAELEVGGFIVKAQGKGSFVAQPDMLRLPSGVMSFTGNAKIQGIRLTTKVLEAEVKKVQSKLDRDFFGLDENGEIMVVKRVRIAEGIPISLEENHFSVKMKSLAEDDLTGSLYELLMGRYRMIPSNKGRRSIYISYASEETAGHLEISTGTPVIDSELCVFDVNGDPIHTVHEIVRGDNNKYMRWYV